MRETGTAGANCGVVRSSVLFIRFGDVGVVKTTPLFARSSGSTWSYELGSGKTCRRPSAWLQWVVTAAERVGGLNSGPAPPYDGQRHGKPCCERNALLQRVYLWV